MTEVERAPTTANEHDLSGGSIHPQPDHHDGFTAPFLDRQTGRRRNVKDLLRKKENQKASNRHCSYLTQYHLLTRLEGLLILQSARRPVGREKVLC